MKLQQEGEGAQLTGPVFRPFRANQLTIGKAPAFPAWGGDLAGQQADEQINPPRRVLVNLSQHLSGRHSQ